MSNQQNWRTPPWLFGMLNADFGPFTLDAAASESNALRERFYTEKENGLKRAWHKRTFCNPPFRDAGAWAYKAFEECGYRDKQSCLLLPVGCSQQWFHDYVLPRASILYPNQRISFNQPNGMPTRNADRDTMIVLFGYEGPKIQIYDVRKVKVRPNGSASSEG